MDWFLYGNGHRHERVKAEYRYFHHRQNLLEKLSRRFYGTGYLKMIVSYLKKLLLFLQKDSIIFANLQSVLSLQKDSITFAKKVLYLQRLRLYQFFRAP